MEGYVSFTIVLLITYTTQKYTSLKLVFSLKVSELLNILPEYK